MSSLNDGLCSLISSVNSDELVLLACVLLITEALPSLTATLLSTATFSALVCLCRKCCALVDGAQRKKERGSPQLPSSA